MTKPRAKGAPTSLAAVDDAATTGHGPAVPPPDRVVTAHQLLTTLEVSRQVQLDPKTVRQLCANGKLRAYRVGRAYRVHPDDLTAWLEAHAIPVQDQLTEAQ